MAETIPNPPQAEVLVPEAEAAPTPAGHVSAVEDTPAIDANTQIPKVSTEELKPTIL